MGPNTEEAVQELRPGIWQHYKGPLYLVEDFGADASNDGDPDKVYVYYVPLELNGSHVGPRKRHREITEFMEWVCVDPQHSHYGEAMTNGSCLQRRFTYRSPSMTEELLSQRLPQ